MRLQNLQLVRYGKFTDTDITLPKSDHDFHLIVGPNEAGKSTVRGAIADLLFGFPMRAAALAFLHPQPELRLAARVDDGDEQLAFVRVKGAKNTLLSPTGAPLADDVLASLLGAADRGFFEKMFGLDHAQLVMGGESILDASKDVSQVLFQSAAGIAGLGQVKAALQDEAGKLWAPRHSATRTYYAASDQMDAAVKDLKTSTVRAKTWSDAREQLDEVAGRISSANERKTLLLTQRAKLERVRRLAPTVQALKSRLAELSVLGEVVDLPANASEILSTGESELSVAETVVAQCRRSIVQQTERRDSLAYNADVLAMREEIEALVAFGQRVAKHYADLPVRQAEIDHELGLARAAAQELGWFGETDDLRTRLPAPLLLRDVQRLVTQHAKLLETKVAADKAVDAKQEELDSVGVELGETAAGEVPASLRSAIADAQALRNTAPNQAKLGSAVNSAERTLETALCGLGQWRTDIKTLQKMSLPSTERLTALMATRQQLEAERNSAEARARDSQHELDVALLDAKQYDAAQHIVTSTDVRGARLSRDTAWRAIKEGSTSLDAGAPGLDAAIALADELVDTQLGSATEAAELQSRRQRVERAELDLAAKAESKTRKSADLATFDREWQELATSVGLPGLALGDVQGWITKRADVIAAVTVLGERNDELQAEVEAAQAAMAGLRSQMSLAGLMVPDGTTLSAILHQAEAMVSQTDSANARREQLQKQLNTADIALSRLKKDADAANAAYGVWETDWQVAVHSAGLSDFVKTVTDAEQALTRVETVRSSLDKAAATKHDRVDSMNRDLAEFEQMTGATVSALAIEELADLEPRQVVKVLHTKLRDAETAHSLRTEAENALRSAQDSLEAAQLDVERIQAKVAPLLSTAGASCLADAVPLVARSDSKRRLVSEIDVARETLVRGSDGFSIDALIAEVQAGDQEQVIGDLARVNNAIEEVQTELTGLAEERLKADQAVKAVGGGNHAAVAESRRQEALAAMADSAERYIKITTGVRLLSWAIDQYREKNQGPMLSRAGAIFSNLTLGRYSKLFVDYEKTPLSLSALRSDGQVEVAGMSEGTRDQLYLALRLAALELHLAKSKSLPFVADDLFINFDDERSTAGLEALRELSTHTQVLFLSHHDHLLPRVQQVFGSGVNVVQLQR